MDTIQIQDILSLVDGVASLVILVMWISTERRDHLKTVDYYRRKELALMKALVAKSGGSMDLEDMPINE